MSDGGTQQSQPATGGSSVTGALNENTPGNAEHASVTKGAAPTSDKKARAATGTGLPWGFVAAAAAGFFLFMHKEQLGQSGGFIIVIGAIFLGIMSANLMQRK